MMHLALIDLWVRAVAIFAVQIIRYAGMVVICLAHRRANKLTSLLIIVVYFVGRESGLFLCLVKIFLFNSCWILFNYSETHVRSCMYN